MFVSRKYLALIHLFACKVAARLDVVDPAHESVERCAAACTGSVMLKPLAKRGVQSFALGLGNQPSLFDQGFVRAEGNVFHTNSVYTIVVRFATKSGGVF